MSDLAIFSLSDEHKMIREAARDFAQNEIAPIAAQFDESGEFPNETKEFQYIYKKEKWLIENGKSTSKKR